MKDIEDEIPFEVPEGWAWCRLFSLVDLFNGDRGVNYPSKSDFVETGIPFVNAGCLSDGVIDYSEANMITQKKYDALRAGKYQKGDILYCLRGSLGKTGIVLDDSKGAISSSLCILRSRKINIYFLHIFLKSSAMKGQQQLYDNGTAQPNLAAKDVASFYLPLPPLEEQEKIVSKIEEIFTQINSLETGKADLQTAIKHAKSKILDLAIHGKLVPQDPSEEPAGKLLEKIRAEKEAKIAAGELKRDKNDSYIYKNPSDNCHYEKFGESKEELLEDPFEIPSEWTWIRLTNICEYIGDGDWIESKDQASEGIRLIQTGNVGNGKFRNKAERSHFISEKTFDKLNCTEIFPGDILISRLPEPVGRSCIIPDIKQRMITAVDCSILRLNEKIILPEYFCYYTQSSAYFSLIQEKCTGTTRLRISRANLEKILLPLPNKIEQKRIIEKVREIFTTLDIIESKLQ